MKILYIAYENVFYTGILQAQVITQFELVNRKYGTEYQLITTLKDSENTDYLYEVNKNKTLKRVHNFVQIYEFPKTVEKTQSIFSFIKDTLSIVLGSIKFARNSDLIHARSYGGGVLALLLSKISGKPFIFDMRGILPEETVQVGKISQRSFKFKLMKLCERLLISNATKVFTVSDNFSKYLKKEFSVRDDKLFNISNPTVYDDSSKPLTKSKSVINFLYSGSCQDWHCPVETLLIFKKIREKFGDYVFLRICSSDKDRFTNVANEINLDPQSYSIDRVPFEEMKQHYTECHIGFCLRRTGLTSKVSCPVKFAEYLASGIYVIANSGVSDFDEIFESNPEIGTLYDRVSCDMDTSDIESYIKLILSGNIEFKPVYLKEFDWDYMSDQVYSQYKEIVDK